ncbi:hypothetical protein HHI36_015997 [Cryptolaemus montrouzieri]|uniref:BLUF domain-containing protein n=1 Tax=Cryptolaemus montrouzieri TaxID=559131 RepID=A0ABD2N8S5_9CUCU
MAARLFRRNKPRSRKYQIVLGVPEPARDSLFDTISENLEQARKHIYVNRIIYLGEHSFDPEEFNKVSEIFRDIVKEINGSYNDEPLTGIFLHYKKYFVHMLEGSEDSINKHFYLLMEDEVYRKFSKMKLVILVNHINQRFINEWLEIPGRPATLLEKIDPECDMEKSGRYIFNCVQKVYQLSREIRDIRKKYEEDAESVDTKHGEKEPSFSFDSSIYEDVLKSYFPEINLLQFLVQTRYLKNLVEYVNVYGNPVVPDTYQDEVWPIPTTMVPYSIFEKPADPCIDLPTHKVEQVEEVLITDDENLTEINV